MGSKTGSNEEEQESIEKSYRDIVNSAYLLFEKRYTIEELYNMPYAELIDKITREDELNKELQKLGETEEIKGLRDQNNRR